RARPATPRGCGKRQIGRPDEARVSRIRTRVSIVGVAALEIDCADARWAGNDARHSAFGADGHVPAPTMRKFLCARVRRRIRCERGWELNLSRPIVLALPDRRV